MDSKDFWRDKDVLVTGGSGFLGSHLLPRLQALRPRSIAQPRSSEYDLRRLDRVEALLGKTKPSLIINLAAVCAGIGANAAEPGRFFYDNLIMGAQLMDAARRFGAAKFVQIGTVCSYPKLTPIPFKEEDFWKGYPEETNAPYGLAKRALLAQSQAYRGQYGFNSIYLIPINLYGPGSSADLESAHVIPALIQKCLEAIRANRAEIDCWGTGRATREFLYVEDAAEAVLLAAERYDKPEPVNLGTQTEIPIKDLAELIVRLTGFKGSIRWDPSKPDGQPRRKLDASRALKEFGFKARTGFEEGLKKTIDWYARRFPL